MAGGHCLRGFRANVGQTPDIQKGKSRGCLEIGVTDSAAADDAYSDFVHGVGRMKLH